MMLQPDRTARRAMRFASLLACLLLLLPAATSALAKDEPATPFVVRTHVIAPHRVGDFVLDGMSYDPKNRFGGVGIRYVLADHPETRFDLFVYPAGRMPAAQALEKGMLAFRGSFDFGVQNGYYTDLRILEDVPFVVASEPAADGSDAIAAPTADPRDPLPEALQMLLKDTRIHGQRMKLAYVHLPSKLPMRSRGYLFYRHMYFFKGRVSAAESRIDEDAFSELTDRAMRELVPAVAALNVGSCANITVVVPEDGSGEEPSDASIHSLVTGLADVRNGNCSNEPADEALAQASKDADVVTIEFQPADWGAQ